MPRTVAIGIQNFEEYITGKCFYVDKTKFISEWWKSSDNTTVVMRPRRFGKTLNMDMVKTFFSLEYKDKGEKIFSGLDIWQDEEMRALQGTYPVIFISFAGIKPTSYDDMKNSIGLLFAKIYREFDYLLKSNKISDYQKEEIYSFIYGNECTNLTSAMNTLAEILKKHHSKKVLIILDEYDTPMLEAYTKGFWHEAVEFLRSFFNSTFKTNPYMKRALMTGITRISKESFFSDFNHVQIVSMQSKQYADYFGFSEEEVFSAMDEYQLFEKDKVKFWYDGFTIGDKTDIYNPWSIIKYLKSEGELDTYWVNTSSNSLINKLMQTGTVNIKLKLDMLLRDEPIEVPLDSEIVFNNIDNDESAIWSLFYASGYLTGSCIAPVDKNRPKPIFSLYITNLETKNMFRNMISTWFSSVQSNYNDFIRALLLDDVDSMEEFINDISLETFSYFDTGTKNHPEKFYHGFVLGLILDLRDRYSITSNRESGFGRYDVMLEPKNNVDNAIIIEFKVFKPRKEKDKLEAMKNALQQIEDKKYEAIFLEKGIERDRIKKYGFVFEGKSVIIGKQ